MSSASHRATVTLPAGYLARDVAIEARDNGDGTAAIVGVDAGGGVWPVTIDGVALDRIPCVSAAIDMAEHVIGEKLFAVPVQRF